MNLSVPSSFGSLCALFLGTRYPVVYVVSQEVERKRVVEELRTWRKFFGRDEPVLEVNLALPFSGVTLQKDLRGSPRGGSGGGCGRPASGR